MPGPEVQCRSGGLCSNEVIATHTAEATLSTGVALESRQKRAIVYIPEHFQFHGEFDCEYSRDRSI